MRTPRIIFKLIICQILSVLSTTAQIQHKSISSFENLTYIDSQLDHPVAILEAVKRHRKTKVYNLFSHGRPGELLIQGQWLNAHETALWLKTMPSFVNAAIHTLNIYGCEFAKGTKGTEAVKYLERELGISIAASTNVTGANGDWNLEIGNNTSSVVINNYKYNLQCTGIIGGLARDDDFDGDGVCNNTDLDDDNDGLLDIDEGCSIIQFPDAELGFLFQATVSSKSWVSTVNLTTGTTNHYTGNPTNTKDSLDYVVNAVTINELDGFFWVVVDKQDGSPQFVFLLDPNTLEFLPPTGQPDPPILVRNAKKGIAAAFDPVNKWYVLRENGNAAAITQVIDADPNSGTYQDTIKTYIDGVPVNLADIVYNDVDGLMYGIGKNNATLYALDIVNETYTSKGVITNLPSGLGTTYGAGYATNSEIFFGQNASGVIYKIDITSTPPTATVAATSNPSSANDGAKLLTIDPNGDISCTDFDGDGFPNAFDLDSDNDGIPDIIEAGGVDLNFDGEVDYPTAGDVSTMVDANSNGWSSVFDDGSADGLATEGGTPLADLDDDSDTRKDRVDVDSDADGILDNVEGQGTAGYIAPSGTDTDGDGIDDAYDVDCTPCSAITGAPFVPYNKDAVTDNIPDYLDGDTDGDGKPDVLEAWDSNANGTAEYTVTGNDQDNDGLDDAFDSDFTPAHDSIHLAAITANALPTTMYGYAGPGTEPNWRQEPLQIFVYAYLEGPHSNAKTQGLGQKMTTDLSTGGSSSILATNALAQPYNTAPWNYAGTETVTANFFDTHTNIVDWVMIELRDKDDASYILIRRACFLTNDGALLDINGNVGAELNAPIDNYFLSIVHRNHANVASATAVSVTAGTATWDIRTDDTDVYTNGTQENVKAAGSDFVMYGGENNNNQSINASDVNAISIDFFKSGYYLGDTYLDGVVNATDVNLISLNFFLTISFY